MKQDKTNNSKVKKQTGFKNKIVKENDTYKDNSNAQA